jgi:hypothetical protein
MAGGVSQLDGSTSIAGSGDILSVTDETLAMAALPASFRGRHRAFASPIIL